MIPLREGMLLYECVIKNRSALLRLLLGDNYLYILKHAKMSTGAQPTENTEETRHLQAALYSPLQMRLRQYIQ